VGSRHSAPAGMDLAVRFPYRAVFHRGALSGGAAESHRAAEPWPEFLRDELCREGRKVEETRAGNYSLPP
jgi:hypothetical protein